MFISNTGGGLDWSRICQKSSKVRVFFDLFNTISEQKRFFFFISAFTHPTDGYFPDFGCLNIKSIHPKIDGEQYVA